MSGRRDVWEQNPGLREIALAQAGVVRRDQLAELGVTRHHVRSQIHAGRWRPVAPAVVALFSGRLDLEQQRWRAVLHVAGPAWLAGLSALEVHGLQGWPRRQQQVLVPMGHHPGPLGGVEIHSTRRPPAVPPVQGPPRVSVPRAAIDGAGWLVEPRAAAGLVLAVMQQRLATPDELEVACREAGAIRHRRTIQQAIRDGAAGAESVAEVDVVALVSRAGLPAPHQQVEGQDLEGHLRRRDVEVDLPDGGVLVISVDGPTHETPSARADDRANDAAVAADGKLLLRIGVEDIRQRPERLVRQLTLIRQAAELRALSRGA